MIRTAKNHWLVFEFLLLFSFVGTVQANVNVIEIRVLPESVVYGDRYAIGEIAELDGFDVEAIQMLSRIKVGMSPLPGRSYLVSKRQIESQIKRRFKKYAFKIVVPKKAIVSRAALKISKEQIKRIVLREIGKQYREYDDVKITIATKLKDIFISKGQVSYQIKRIGGTGQIGGYSSWMLSLELNKKIVKKMIVRAKIDVFEDVLIAKSKIRKGTKVTHSDLTTIKKNVSREREGHLVPSDLIVGQQARRDILRNESVKENLVEEPIIMKKGTPVIVVYETKNIKLTNLATAMKSGRKGDIIPVRTVSGKVTIYAVIVDSKKVAVAL